jgi:glucose-6-phosphate 1-epimerase
MSPTRKSTVNRTTDLSASLSVVWNPWEKKSKTMIDLGDEEYKQMLCVDAAAVERAITLKPGEEWTGKLELSAVLSTNCSDHLDHPVSI